MFANASAQELDRDPVRRVDGNEESFTKIGPSIDNDRHYLQDPGGLAEKACDEDERGEDDMLVLDQRELEELGLVLDDPHQPEAA
jgi:hypothetical protein